MTATKLEIKLLEWIVQHEMSPQNGDLEIDDASDMCTYLWVDDAADYMNLTMSQVKGVIGSCVKKGYVNVWQPDRSDEEPTIDGTQAGFDIFLANKS